MGLASGETVQGASKELTESSRLVYKGVTCVTHHGPYVYGRILSIWRKGTRFQFEVPEAFPLLKFPRRKSG